MGGEGWRAPLSWSQTVVQWTPLERLGRGGGKGGGERECLIREQGLSPESTWGRGLCGNVGQSQGHIRLPESELWAVAVTLGISAPTGSIPLVPS